MATYASVSDVTQRWARTPTDEETALITVRLADAERLIKRRFTKLGRDLAAEITDTTLDVEDVKQVEADAVLRLVRNPEGYLSETDGNYTYMLTQDMATGRLEILPEEWEILGVGATGVFIIEPNPVMPV